MRSIVKIIVPDNPPLSSPKCGGINFLGDLTIYDIIISMKHKHIEIIMSTAGLAALILLLTLTSPTETGPLGVLVFFTTLYIAIFGIIVLFMRTFYRLAFKKSDFRGKDYLYSAILSFGPIMILMARSFGAVTPWTVSLILIFLILAEFLVYKRI